MICPQHGRQHSIPYGFITILSTLAWGLGYFGMPISFCASLAISHEDKLKTSRRIASIWVVISMFVAILIGIIGYGASVAGGIPMFSSSSESETVIIRLAVCWDAESCCLLWPEWFWQESWPVPCPRLTQLLTAASGVSQNLLQDFLKIKMDTKRP